MSGQLLEVTIHAGPTAGQRIRVNRSPAAFGRDPENALVLGLPTVSRVHGELRYDNGRWSVVNLSPNGTKVNRRAVGKKPRQLEDGDQIIIGNEAVMTVATRATDDDSAVEMSEDRDIGAAPAPVQRQKMTARTKLWMTIIGFWAIVGLTVLFYEGGSSPVAEGPKDLPVLSESDIATAIREPQPKREPSPRNAVEHFDEAQAYYQSIGADPQNAFRAFDSYKTALSYAYGDSFTNPRDDWGGKTTAELAIAGKRYLELEQQLIRDVTRLYEDAVGKLRDGRLSDARQAFERVYKLYSDSSSEIYRNAQRQRDLARRRLEAKN